MSKSRDTEKQKRSNCISEQLRGGDRRSIGRSNEVVAEVLRQPEKFVSLLQAILSEDRLVQMRAADAAEKVTSLHPEWLEPYQTLLLWEIAEVGHPEVRWHVAQMLPRLRLQGKSRKRAIDILEAFLSDGSSIVRTFAMQALADLAQRDRRLREKVIPLIQKLTRTGTPAMKSRGRKLLRVLAARQEENS